ncbi:hypothetical protein N9937_02195 [bacterium]|nr:hypothetical protein [bacterium]
MNKKYWRNAETDAALLCYSPSRQAKEYWLEAAREEGFVPILYLQHSTRQDAMDRMMARPKNNDLRKEVNDWFKHYTPHQDEVELPIIERDPIFERRVYQP